MSIVALRSLQHAQQQGTYVNKGATHHEQMCVCAAIPLPAGAAGAAANATSPVETMPSLTDPLVAAYVSCERSKCLLLESVAFWSASVSMSMVTDLMHSFLMKCMEQCAWRNAAFRAQCEQFSLHVTQLRGRGMGPAHIFPTLWPPIKALLDGRSQVALSALHFNLIEDHVSTNNSIKKAKQKEQAKQAIASKYAPYPSPKGKGKGRGRGAGKGAQYAPTYVPDDGTGIKCKWHGCTGPNGHTTATCRYEAQIRATQGEAAAPAH